MYEKGDDNSIDESNEHGSLVWTVLNNLHISLDLPKNGRYNRYQFNIKS